MAGTVDILRSSKTIGFLQVIQTLGTEKARPAIAPQVITSFRSVGSLLYETKRKTTFPLQSF